MTLGNLLIACTAKRGLRVAEWLHTQLPTTQLAIATFREEAHEPPYFEQLSEAALSRNAMFFETRDLGNAEMQSYWSGREVDLVLLVGWRHLVPMEIAKRARLGTFAFHDSLLPAYRGFSPTCWAIINGEDHTGATLFEVTDQVDAGDILDQRRVPIGPDDYIHGVMERVTDAYLNILDHTLDSLASGTATRKVQDHSQATYTTKRLPEDNHIDWNRSARTISNLVRAVSSPYPGAFTHIEGQRLKIWQATAPPDGPSYVGGVPGRVVGSTPEGAASVVTGDGVLLIETCQLEGGEAVPAAQVLRSLSQTLGR